MQVSWTTSFESTPLASDFGSTSLIRLAEIKSALEERLSVEHYFDYSSSGGTPVMSHKAGQCSVVNVSAGKVTDYPPTWPAALVYTNGDDTFSLDIGTALIQLGTTLHADLTTGDDGLQTTVPYFDHLALKVAGQSYSYTKIASGTTGTKILTGTGFTSSGTAVALYDILYIPQTQQKLQVLAVSDTSISLSANLTQTINSIAIYGYRELYASKNWIANINTLNINGNYATGLPSTPSAYNTSAIATSGNKSSLIVSVGGHTNSGVGTIYQVHPNYSFGSPQLGADALKPTLHSTTSIPYLTSQTATYANMGWFAFWPSILNNTGTFELHPEYTASAAVLDSPAQNADLGTFVAAGWTGATVSVVCIASDLNQQTMQWYALTP